MTKTFINHPFLSLNFSLLQYTQNNELPNQILTELEKLAFCILQ
jgi:hypothetical protein